MIKIRYTITMGQVALGLKALGSDGDKAIIRALNRTADSVKTQAVGAIAEDLAIAKKRVRANLGVSKAYPGKLSASVEAVVGGSGVVAAKSKSESRGRIPLFEFRARGSSRKGGIHYRLPGSKGFIPEAFFARMESGHLGAFSRLPGTVGPRSGREKIAELYGPSLPYIFRKHIKSSLNKFASEAMKKNLVHEISFLLFKNRIL
jgi:hypothetical protein